jgi:tetratricopeptide (TPR) repeat protein
MVFLSACATSVVNDKPAIDSVNKADSEVVPKLVSIEPVRPKIDLTGDLMYRILEAEFAGQRGHIETSLTHYSALALETRDPKIVERATRIAVYARETDTAEEMANLWTDLDPRNPDPHQVLAVMALRDGDVKSSLTHLESILDYTYGDVEQKLLMVANLLGREGDKDVIIEVMNKLIATRQDSPEILFAFSRVATILGEFDFALELMDMTYQLNPDDETVALGYVAILQLTGRSEEAITWLENVMRKHKGDDSGLRMNYARLLLETRRYDEAQEQFEKLISQKPDNPDVMFSLALLYLQSGQIDDADDYFSSLSETGHRANEVNYYLGRIAEDRDDLVEASIWYQGVRGGVNYFDSQVRLGIILANQDRLEDARLHLSTIRTQNEGESVALVQAEAGLLVEVEEYNEAMKIYDRAIENGYNTNLLYSRAMLAEKIDRLDISEADLRHIIRREPENSLALNALGYTLADKTDRFEEAEELIDQAIEISPHDHYILDSKGWVLYRMGKLEEAILYLRRALDIIPDAEIAAHLGEVLWVKGDKKEASKVWKTALKAAPDSDLLKDIIERFNPRF